MMLHAAMPSAENTATSASNFRSSSARDCPCSMQRALCTKARTACDLSKSPRVGLLFFHWRIAVAVFKAKGAAAASDYPGGLLVLVRRHQTGSWLCCQPFHEFVFFIRLSKLNPLIWLSLITVSQPDSLTKRLTPEQAALRLSRLNWLLPTD